MDRQEQHVAAIIKNRLRPVAMVKIDIEHSDLSRPAIAQRLRGNRGIIQKTIPAEHILRRMVSRRTAERKSGSCALVQQLGSGQRNLRRCLRRFPCPAADRGFGGETVIANPAINIARNRNARHPARRPRCCNRLALKPFRLPITPTGLQELDKLRVVNFQDWIEAKIIRLHQVLMTPPRQLGQNMLDPLRAFERRHEQPPVHLGF